MEKELSLQLLTLRRDKRSMTKSFIYQLNPQYYKSWEKSIIAPDFNLKNFVNEIHYYLRIYINSNMAFWKSIKFLFLNIIQRLAYTYGTFKIKLENPK